MPRKTDLEAKLIEQLATARTALAKQQADQRALEKKIAAERYRKQRVWEAQVGRLAWHAGLNVLELSEIEQLIHRLTPQDLSPGTPVPSVGFYEAAVIANS